MSRIACAVGDSAPRLSPWPGLSRGPAGARPGGRGWPGDRPRHL